jgi:hypothetical protein
MEMRRWRRAAQALFGAGLLVLAWPAAGSAAPCDEYNPAAPARSGEITLTANDAADEGRDELRSFIETGSLGRVEVAVLSATPPGIVSRIAALPEISGFSPRYGERLKGVAVTVHLKTGLGRAVVVLRLRQVCARYFRNTFLYY